MKITFITLFPEFVEQIKHYSIFKKAIANNLIEIETINPRDFAPDNKVDDYVYGGGSGMLLQAEWVFLAIQKVRTDDSRVILLSPRGKKLDQDHVITLAKFNHLILVSGHYEGIDQRIADYIDEEVSIGEFVVTGGEIPSMMLIDAIIRRIPNVIKAESANLESWDSNMIEWDNYTRPLVWKGKAVPNELVQGNHQEVSEWRKKNQHSNTIEYYLKEYKENNGN